MTATEFRTDPITGRTVVIVPGRAARPNEHAVRPPSASTDADCPFCEGNEASTPAELAVDAPAGHRPNSPGWFVRTIPNKFPTVASEDLVPSSREQSSVLVRDAAFGYHEVVIESPTHSPSLGFLPPAQVERVVKMCRDRVRYLAAQARVDSVTLFENSGPESGGSLWHPHAQIVTVPGTSPSLREEMDGASRFLDRRGGPCALEAVVREELASGERRLIESKDFVAYAPFASAVPYEARLVPKRHARSFADVTDTEVAALAEPLASLLRAFLTVLPGASYNFVVRSPSAATVGSASYHWHLDLYPRLVRPDGFDLGSGYAVNTVAPEVAAEALRDALAGKR